jgi:hypothetical protein
MPLIKPRTRGKQMVRHITRLDRENHDALQAYAEFIGEPTEYVLNELIDTVLAKDKDFVKWRAEHPGPGAPQASGSPQGDTRPSLVRTASIAAPKVEGAATPLAAGSRPSVRG